MKIIDALKKGKMLANPEIWKRLQNVVTLIGGIAPFIVLIMPSLGRYLSPDMVAAAYAALGAVSIYLTVSTTEKLGV